MIFVYIKKWNIVKKSKDRLQDVDHDLILESKHSIKDDIVFDSWKIILYSDYKKASSKIDPIEKPWKQPIIKPTKQKKEVLQFVHISKQRALLRKIQSDDKIVADDRIRTEGRWPKGWYIKPCKPRLRSK